MSIQAQRRATIIVAGTFLLGLLAAAAVGQDRKEPEIDFGRARQLLERVGRGERLSPEESEYLERARAARRQGGARTSQGGPARLEGRGSTGLVPICEMSEEDRYQGEDGGLYGGGRNVPPEAHRRAAEEELDKIEPLNAEGEPDARGKVVLVSISMSNATQEFSVFKRMADADPAKADSLTIVDCAQGGQAMREWADPQAAAWAEAERRLAAAGVTSRQVQVAWVKLANKGPRGDLRDHGEQLRRDTIAVLQIARQRFPNLRIAYLSSRIYGGYATSPLNPEPYAYESGFVVRWLIRDQIEGNEAIGFDAGRGAVKAPLLVWGPYLWADGTKGRKADDLIWERDDLAADGTHPSGMGREKVARLLLEFFRSDPLARAWFAKR